ncbi:hypothetical protein LCGC14_1190460 [marine sediment metagenome]|uniref:Uncharacterized protein n=1 Tax=marine sediment metagenome TaxID=412755 RepID=A0A0F9M7A8_9ZZZZ
MKNHIVILCGLLLLSTSCSDDDDRITAPNGQYRVIEKICYCSFPDDGSIEYWIFDLPSNKLTVRVIDNEGQLTEKREMFYGTKGDKIVLGEGREHRKDMVDGILELVYLDDSDVIDDELTVRLAPY